jgi:hypothetical protein
MRKADIKNNNKVNQNKFPKEKKLKTMTYIKSTKHKEFTSND